LFNSTLLDENKSPNDTLNEGVEDDDDEEEEDDDEEEEKEEEEEDEVGVGAGVCFSKSSSTMLPSARFIMPRSIFSSQLAAAY